MAGQYDFYWHGPFEVFGDKNTSPQKRLEETIPRKLYDRKGLYMLVGQRGWKPWTRRPLYIGATMNSFEKRLLAHLKTPSENKAVVADLEENLETGLDQAKILAAEEAGWRISSLWLGEARTTMKLKVHDLVHAERTMIFYFDPLLNKALKTKPAAECTIINRINSQYISKSGIFEWQATHLPSIWDMRKANMKNSAVDSENIIAEIYRKKRANNQQFVRKYLAYERGALWNRKFCKSPPQSEFEKPSIFPSR